MVSLKKEINSFLRIIKRVEEAIKVKEAIEENKVNTIEMD